MSELIYKKVAERLKQADLLMIAAGAGMGKDSGMPDFRGQDGFWKNYPPFRGKFDFYQCANPMFLIQHPHHFWGFYGHRLNMYRNVTPHVGFTILQNLGKKFRDHYVITSNVDGHFSQFFSPQHIFEVHGSIHHLQCDTCQTIIPNNFHPQIDEKQMRCSNLPTCPTCQNILRPNILMFNDWQWISDRTDEQQKQYKKFVNKTGRTVILEFGCGVAVPRIRTMCEQHIFLNKQSTLIRINPEQQNLNSQNKRLINLPVGAKQALINIEKFYNST